MPELQVGRHRVMLTVKELAEYTAELDRLAAASTRTLVQSIQVGGSSARWATPPTSASASSPVLDKLFALKPATTIAYIKDHPAADVGEMTSALIGHPVTWADGPVAYHRAYHKLAHARKVLNLPAPSSPEGSALWGSKPRPAHLHLAKVGADVDRGADPLGLLPKLRALTKETIESYVLAHPDANPREAAPELLHAQINAGRRGKIVYDNLYNKMKAAKARLRERGALK
jgi:hypothetical protein